MRLRNISPLGHLDVPAIARQGEPLGEPGKGCLEPGEEFDVADDATAQSLLALEGVFEAVDNKPRRGRTEGNDEK